MQTSRRSRLTTISESSANQTNSLLGFASDYNFSSSISWGFGVLGFWFFDNLECC